MGVRPQLGWQEGNNDNGLRQEGEQSHPSPVFLQSFAELAFCVFDAVSRCPDVVCQACSQVVLNLLPTSFAFDTLCALYCFCACMHAYVRLGVGAVRWPRLSS